MLTSSLLFTKDTMVNLENDWVNLVLSFDHCLFLSLTRNHVTSDTNNKNKKQSTMLKTSFAVGIHIDVIAVIGDVDEVVCWWSQHESIQQPLLQL
jgi:hypothetical protein